MELAEAHFYKALAELAVDLEHKGAAAIEEHEVRAVHAARGALRCALAVRAAHEKCVGGVAHKGVWGEQPQRGARAASGHSAAASKGPHREPQCLGEMTSPAAFAPQDGQGAMVRIWSVRPL